MVQNASHPADCFAIWTHLRLVWKGKNRTFTINGSFFTPQNNTKRSDLHDHKTDVSYISNQQKLYEVGYKSKGNYILQNILSLFSHKLYFYWLAFYYWTIKRFFFQKFTYNLFVYMNFIWCLNSTKFNSKR